MFSEGILTKIIIKIITIIHANAGVKILSHALVENIAINKIKKTTTIKTTNQGSIVLTYNSAEEKLIKTTARIKLVNRLTHLLPPKILVLASKA